MTDDVALMGHLMRRAAFGAPAAELEALAERGYDAVVDDLLHPERFDRLEEDLFDRYHWDMVHFRSGEMTAARWFYRMVNSSRPLEEKTALLWHGIFATGGAKVTINTWMSAQIDMFRDYGLGSFRELLVNLSRDPAMIYWLDNQTNHSDAPNENYGRELLELFSMGVGNYSEDDVKQCARAFTGWSINQMLPRYPYGFYETKFVYRPDDHDDSVKEFLGAHGAFDGEDVVDVIVRNPATADFIARKLYNFFVSDTPDEEAQAELAQAYFDCDYEIRGVLRHLFHADWFKEARFKKVRSPSETVATTIKLAGLHRTPREYGLMKLPGVSEGMGQTLLNPPTVEGMAHWQGVDRHGRPCRTGQLHRRKAQRSVQPRRLADGRSHRQWQVRIHHGRAARIVRLRGGWRGTRRPYARCPARPRWRRHYLPFGRRNVESPIR